MSNFAFQVTGAFQGNGEFAFQGQTGVVVITPPVVGGSGKSGKRLNEIIEIEGKRFVVPKTQVAEFLAKYGPQPAPVVDIPTPPSITPSLQTVSFTTPKGKTVTVDRQVVTDDIGVILVMCALADEDFYE